MGVFDSEANGDTCIQLEVKTARKAWFRDVDKTLLFSIHIIIACLLHVVISPLIPGIPL